MTMSSRPAPATSAGPGRSELHDVTLAALRGHVDDLSARGIADAVTAALRSGELVPGDLLPPVRRVAEGLAVSPTTVSAAWSLLSRAGAIRTNGRHGTRIAELQQHGSARYRQALEARPRFALDLATGVPDADLLPDLGRALRSAPRVSSAASYLDEPVLPELEQQLRATWAFEPERLLVVDGAMDAMDQLVDAALRPGDQVIVEDPTFPPLLDLLDAADATTIGVPVDQHGMRPGELAAALGPRVRAVVLQPRGHNPTGAALTQERLAELAEVLGPHGCWIVEDDSTGELSTAPPVSFGTVLPERTVHVRSFSKTHGPDLRLAAIGGPASVIGPLTERRLLGQGWTSRLLQSVLLQLLQDRQAVEAVEHARAEYARRRALLVGELAAHGVHLPAGDGLNIWLPVLEESAALVMLASRGIGAAAGRPFQVAPDGEPHLRITSGLLATGHADVAADLAAAAHAPGWSGPR